MCSPQRKVIISRLIDPSEGELDTLVEILSAAFQNDVGMASLSGNSTRVQSDIYRRTLRASSKQGQLHVGRFEDDPANQIRGLAAWIAPGEDWQCYQQEPFIEGLSSYLREWYEYHYIPTYEELYKLSFRSGAEARQGSFNLKFLAVRPDSQGKRIGTELLTKLCNQADADGRHVLADVKSHFHVQWFRKYSFTYRSVKNFTSKDCAGFPLWCMARDPRTIAQAAATLYLPPLAVLMSHISTPK